MVALAKAGLNAAQLFPHVQLVFRAEIAV